MAYEIRKWLEGLGLGEYAEAFEESAIRLHLLPSLTDQDLREIGVAKLGHRKELLNAIAAHSALGNTEAATPALQTSSPAQAEAERRQLTVMFCDLVGSTALSRQIDPEDLRDVIRDYQNAVAGEIARFDGHVAKFMGDGVLAYFGWPIAHEDDGERAVRAGMSIIQAMAGLKTLQGKPLAARLGVATGLVVVGDLVGEGASQEEAVVGETPNLAARLQALAEPGQIVIAASTRRLLGAAFDFDELAPRHLKGLGAPVVAYVVTGERVLESRFEARTGPALLPMAGRDQELALLLERWSQAKAGEGQGVLLVGEAGIGKSRLARALIDEVAPEQHTRIRYQCSPYHTDSALWPVIQQLTFGAEISADDINDVKLDKVEALLEQGREEVADAAPLIADLLGLDGEARYGKLDLTPRAQRNRTLRVLADQLVGLATRRPVLLVLEDAHWIDPTMHEMIEHCLDRVDKAQVLMLLTSRPDNQPEVAAHPAVTRFTLNRLARAGVEEIVSTLRGNTVLPFEVIDAIISRTDGVPLFVEELTRAILETGETTIPASLHDSLMARLDHVPEVKEVAQVAACIGREFDFPLLAAVADKPQSELVTTLDKLAAAGLVYRRGAPPEAHYTFKHALVRDAAYESLLRRSRQHYHQEIAQLFEERFGEVAETQPELVAHHYTEAGAVESAISYWGRAGRRAIQRSANLEAVSHLQTALRMIADLRETEERDRQEMHLQLALGPALIAAKDYAAPAVGAVYARARELCERLGAIAELCLVLRGFEVHHLVCGDTQKARELGEQLLQLAERQDSDTLLIGARQALGQTLFLQGHLSEARIQLQGGISLYDPQQHRFTDWPGGHPGEQCHIYDAFALQLLGFPEQAIRRGYDALRLVQGLSQPLSLASILGYLSLIHAARREPKAAQKRAKAAIEISIEQQIAYYLGWGLSASGWAASVQHDGTTGRSELQEGIETVRAVKARVVLPYLLALQAEAESRAGRNDAGLAAVDEALTLVADTDERCWEAELHRIKGDLLLAASPNDPMAAEECLQKALDVARRQEARSWELRASTSLAKLWRQQGKVQEAGALLRPVYNWFTEGFDTPDLIDAKALLDDLS